MIICDEPEKIQMIRADKDKNRARTEKDTVRIGPTDKNRTRN